MLIKSVLKTKTLGDRSKAVVFALLLVLTIAVPMFALPPANAHTPPWTISTYAFLNVAPNPVGVGQTAYVNFWLDKIPPTASAGWGMMWHNMTVTVTKPDGTTEKLGPFNSDAVGGAWTQYTPTQTGNYTFVFNFPGQKVVVENPYPYPQFMDTGQAFINDTYTDSTSNVVTLTVQQQQITTAYPDNPLPTSYWQRPINSMNRNWYSIAGNWLGLAAGSSFAPTGSYDQNGNFNPYTTAPDSAHIVWTKQEAFGGQIGGAFGGSDTAIYASGTAYEPKFAPVIMNGVLYYTDYPGDFNNPGPLTAVNLRTGQTLWTLNATNPLRVGMTYDFVSGDQYGAHAYIFTAPAGGFIIPTVPTKWSMYDAMTGQWILDIANVTAGTLVAGPNGEILSYTVAGGMLTMWNSSLCVATGSTKNQIYAIYSAAEIWRPPHGATIDWNGGNQWTMPVANNVSGVPLVSPLAISKISDGVILMTGSSIAGQFGVPGGSQAGYRIDAGYSATTGQLLWGPINRTLTPWTNVVIGATGEGVYTEYTLQTKTWTGYDIASGQKLWGPTAPKDSAWGYYDFQCPSVIGYGNLYEWGISGVAYCYDVKTGALKWTWDAGSAGVDSPYGTWPLGMFGGYDLADGKLYLAAGHDYTPPVFKGAQLYCINASSGQEIWDSLCFSIDSSPAVADGYLVKFNGYDNQIYAYGKGLTATTVACSPAIGSSSRVLIQGTVTDQSPGQTCLGIPAAGTPAISDASMNAWMNYLYEQQPKPTNATGVSVHLTAIDPNGNFQDIGTVTSDVKGNYFAPWTPPVPGLYAVTATFEGSSSYYSSDAETGFLVSAAPSAAVTVATPVATNTPTQTVTPTLTLMPTTPISPSPVTVPPTSAAPTMTYIAVAAAVIILAIIAAAVAFMRRK